MLTEVAGNGLSEARPISSHFCILLIHTYIHADYICMYIYIYIYVYTYTFLWWYIFRLRSRPVRSSQTAAIPRGKHFGCSGFIPHRQFCLPKMTHLELSFIPEVLPSNHWDVWCFRMWGFKMLVKTNHLDRLEVRSPHTFSF